MTTPVTLRPHQIEAADAIEAAWRAGIKRPLADMCVASGKSLTMAEVARREIARGGRVLIGAHVRELVEQNARACADLGLQVGINAAALGQKTWRGPVISCSIQSVYRYARNFGPISLFLGDEAHLWPHSEAGMYRQLARDLGDVRIAGFSGTVFRLQGGSLIEGEGAPFDAVSYQYSILDGIRDGYLCPAFSIGADDTVDTSRLKTRQGEFTAESSDAQMLALMDSHIAQMVHHGWTERRAWLVFEAGTKSAKAMAARMGEWGIPTGLVLGETGAAERSHVVEMFRQGRLRALVNVNALTTGFDVPSVDLLVMRRPTKSLGLYIQQCLDAQTEVLSARGWLQHSDVRDDDQVAGFDTVTGAVEWCPILNRIERPLADGESMFGVIAPHLDIRVTGGHDMIVRSRSETTKRWLKEPAVSVAARRSMFRLPVAGVQTASSVNLTDDEIRLVGWYLTDGCLNKKTNQLLVSQSESKPAHCAEIRRVLTECGIKFGESSIKRTGMQAQYAPNRVFYASKGAPRGRDKHLRGWAHLAAWFDKSIGPAFDLLDARQLAVLLGAMWLGDGANAQRTITWVSRTGTITTGDNETMADRLQALCVTRGFRCNKATQQARPTEWNATPKPLFVLHIQARDMATVAGAGDSDGSINSKSYRRSRFAEVSNVPGETVWCVENRLGTLVTRRNGKVAIVGNCGRALRTIGGNITASVAAGKADCAVLDFAGNIDRHGPLDFIRPAKSKARLVRCEECGSRVPSAAKKCWSCDAPMTKLCPVCLVEIPKGTLDCPACGHDMRAPESEGEKAAKLRETPSGAALISSWKGGTAREGGWLPVGRSWAREDGGMLVDGPTDRHELPSPLAIAIRGVAPRWLRLGHDGAVEAVLVPNGASRNSARQVAADGREAIVPMPREAEGAAP